jgi:hypothetical protein
VHIEDISRAFLAVLEAPVDLVHNEAFNVGRSEDNYRIRELAEIVKETVPGTEIEYAADAGPDQRCYRVDCGKIQRVLPSFQPAWNARRGAEELYTTYKRIGLKVDDFEGVKYKRIAHIRHLIAEGVIDGKLRRTADEPSETEYEAVGAN